MGHPGWTWWIWNLPGGWHPFISFSWGNGVGTTLGFPATGLPHGMVPTTPTAPTSQVFENHTCKKWQQSLILPYPTFPFTVFFFSFLFFTFYLYTLREGLLSIGCVKKVSQKTSGLGFIGNEKWSCPKDSEVISGKANFIIPSREYFSPDFAVQLKIMHWI